ncbi:hypothetical protein [Microbacterium sp. bgisy203]|uniref:hypothetical protein n=1 Tax=Microbacterium sp. bgisy203 TaxID=3413799 RepID=UPI003D751B5B
MSRLREEGAHRFADDRGAALVMVMAVGALLSMLMAILVAVSVNGARQASEDADWNAALAAAYAGVDEYQSHLSADTSYYRFGNSAAPFSKESGSVLTTPSGSNANPAFGIGAGGTWGTVNGSDGRAQFRYEVDNAKYATTGRIRVRSTGKVGDVTRTVTADLKQQGFIDFLYFTDYEVQDPDIVGKPDKGCYKDPDTRTVLKYAWETRTASDCNEITFASGDVITGPVHSNDTIRTCGTRFEGTVTTANTKTPITVNTGGCAAAKFTLSGYPTRSDGVIGMPATNSELKKETRSDLTESDVPRPGCLYTGPTQFTFFSNGTVNIKSPFTKVTRIANAAATEGSAPDECGKVAELGAVGGATIPVPENNVMYVQNVPAVTGDKNYWAPGATPSGFTCTSTAKDKGRRGWTFGAGGYPITGEVAADPTPYGCRSGDAFVSGSFQGASTIAAENYVFVVGDVTYVDSKEDILGLVGNNAVWVYNPVNSSNKPILGKDRTIHAAILSVAHTFQVQNYSVGGKRGNLTVLGAIAQKYRGPVGTSSGGVINNGYIKAYTYDERFKFKAPPKFLNPVTTTYGVTTWVESAAAFDASGAAP